jgi:HAMP domain-containing protein
MGRSLYMARPIRSEAPCATCHSVPSAGPPTLLARYGRDNGFGWLDNEIVGAQVISVPYATATANAGRAFRGLMMALIATFAVTFAVVNSLLYSMLVRPVRRIVHIADRLSVGDMSAADFPQRGPKEITSLGRSFNRMRTSLDKALRLLER